MNILTTIKKTAGPRVGLATLVLKKHSPELMVGGGVTGGVVAAILLARAHNQSEERFEDIFDRVDAIKQAIEDNNIMVQGAIESEMELPEGAGIVSRTEAVKELMPTYLEFAKEAAILYGPSILLGAFSIGMIVGGHGILRRRNQALFSAFVLIERGFNTYRERVRAELGEEGDRRFLYGLEKRKKTIITTDKNGKEKRKRVEEDVLPEEISPIIYQKIFSNTNLNWQGTSEQNYFWLGVCQSTLTENLRYRGFLMLNDVYKQLGLEPTRDGALVGWSLAAPGDNFVDFGIANISDEESGEFQLRVPNLGERPDGSILLDFNVNGPVFDYIGVSTPFKDQFGE